MILLRTPRISLATGADLIRTTRHYRGYVHPGLDPAGPWVNPDAVNWSAMRRRRYFGPWLGQRGSLNFDAVDDVITGPNYTTGPNLSLFSWIYPKSIGEGGEGRIFSHDNGTLERIILRTRSVATPWLSFVAGYTLSYGEWRSPTSAIALNAWQSCAVTYTHENPANDPLLYLHGINQSLTELLTPNGTAHSDGLPLYAGNDSTTSTTFDGWLAELAIWNVILTANENAIIHFLGPLAIPNSLQIYWPLWEAAAKDFSGNARHGTVTGAVLAEDPPIPATRPSAYWISGIVAQALAATLTGIGLLQLSVFRELAGLLASIPGTIAQRFVTTALAATTTTIGLLTRVPSKLLAATALTTALMTFALSKVLAATTVTIALMTSGLSKVLAATLTGTGLLHALKRIAQDRQGRWRPRFLIRMDWP